MKNSRPNQRAVSWCVAWHEKSLSHACIQLQADLFLLNKHEVHPSHSTSSLKVCCLHQNFPYPLSVPRLERWIVRGPCLLGDLHRSYCNTLSPIQNHQIISDSFPLASTHRHRATATKYICRLPSGIWKLMMVLTSSCVMLQILRTAHRSLLQLSRAK